MSRSKKLTNEKRTGRSSLCCAALFLALNVVGVNAYAGAAEQAKRIHDRLTGVPPTLETLSEMTAILSDPALGDAAGFEAALHAIDLGDSDDFYNVTLKNWAAPWTNRDHDVFVPLNDYIATAIGFVRDERDFRELLYADVLYTGRDGLSGVDAYSLSSNNHYVQLEAGLERSSAQGISLKDDLIAVPQSSLTGLPPEAVAGVITSRAASKAFFIVGTNRANFRFTLLNHMCVDLEQVHDTTRAADRIRQDISRSPGGDSRLFLNSCIGCHSGQDPMAQAFAYHNYSFNADGDPTGDNGQIEYTPGVVQPKYFNNDSNFPNGFITPNDDWANYWRGGKNVNLGWDPTLPGRGAGAATMLQEMSHSTAYAQCHVARAFSTVCLREPQDAADRAEITSLLTDFTGNGYNLKRVFARSAAYCKGE
ncbi:MAG: hypothetical protein COA42_11870 [Alteromonadaceae bacterium]|nr:MAG: hypothetical protein COA42_11870 [Alteromonadaceae bacterium]